MMHAVMHMMKANGGSLKPLTVRIPAEEYERLKKYARAQDISLNSVVAEAIAQYEARAERREAISRIRAFQRRLRESRKQGSDSVEFLRQMREARADRQIRGDETFAGREEAGSRRPGAGSSGRSCGSSNRGSGSGWTRSDTDNGSENGWRKP